MAKTKKPKLTEAQQLLGIHLRELKLDFEYEYRFLETRKFRFDVFIPLPKSRRLRGVGIECNGHFRGTHGQGWGGDNEKIRLAQVHGYLILPFTNQEVESGAAKAFIQEWLL